jgi:putative nucleotidyltransferase with HDIG domain
VQRLRMDANELVERAEETRLVPRVMQRVHQAIAEGVAEGQLRAVVAEDGASSALLVRLADARAGGDGAVVGLSDAVALLGPTGTRDALWTLIVASEAAGSSDRMRRALWGHALRTGCLAAVFVEDDGQEDVALLAGMLHDLGVLLLYDVGPPTYRDVVRRAGPAMTGLQEMEAHAIGITHVDLGAFALRRWGYPEEVVAAVTSHHAASPAGVAGAVATADLVDTWLELGASLPDVIEEVGRLSWGLPARLGTGEAIAKAVVRGLERADWYLELAARDAALHVSGEV